MRDDRADVQPALQHGSHLVPGLEHLAAVDALHVEALEDDLVPGDARVLGHDAEQGHGSTVVHRAQQVAEGLRVAGHLHAHVKSFFHAEVFDYVVEFFTADIHGACGAHLPRQVQPVVVHVGDDYMPGADVLGDGHGHDPDGASAGDQHVFADDAERQSRMRGVAEGVEDAGQFVVDDGREFEDIGGGQ